MGELVITMYGLEGLPGTLTQFIGSPDSCNVPVPVQLMVNSLVAGLYDTGLNLGAGGGANAERNVPGIAVRLAAGVESVSSRQASLT